MRGNPEEIQILQGSQVAGGPGGGEHSHFYLMPLWPTDDSGSDTRWGAQETVMLLRGSDLRVLARADCPGAHSTVPGASLLPAR